MSDPTKTVKDDVSPHLIHSIDDPEFEPSYTELYNYFGPPRNEIETREVLAQRMRWDPSKQNGDFALYYEMAVYKNAQGKITLVGDYSVTLSRSAIAAGHAAVVHLSHILAPDSKLTGNKKSEPHEKSHVQTRMYDVTVAAARKALRLAGLPENTPIVLAGEMEPIIPIEGEEPLSDEQKKERTKRVARFLHVGLTLVDPDAVSYLQPDFRPPEEIDASGASQPLRLYLMLRRLGREAESRISAAEIRHVANCLYHMYSQGIRAQDMVPAYRSLDQYPPDDSLVRLLERLP